MVDILNIKWDGRYASATLVFDGDKNRTCDITVNCESREIIVNTYEEGKRPKTAQSMWY